MIRTHTSLHTFIVLFFLSVSCLSIACVEEPDEPKTTTLGDTSTTYPDDLNSTNPHGFKPCAGDKKLGYYTPLVGGGLERANLFKDQIWQEGYRVSQHIQNPSSGLFSAIDLNQHMAQNGFNLRTTASGLSHDPRCRQVFDLFKGSQTLTDDPEGFEYMSYGMNLAIQSNFVFPQTLQQAQDTPLTQEIDGHLRISIEKYKIGSGRARTPVWEKDRFISMKLECDKKAQVTKGWSPKRSSNNPDFCTQDEHGDTQCVEFRLNFDANTCSFAKILDLSHLTETPSTSRVHLKGSLTYNEEKDGYTLHLEQVSVSHP